MPRLRPPPGALRGAGRELVGVPPALTGDQHQRGAGGAPLKGGGLEMTKRLQIYKCDVCGNIVEMQHEGI
ncbi:MAG: hypothetical protein ACYTFZ_10975, partial [Planctomycetota bacterium]